MADSKHKHKLLQRRPSMTPEEQIARAFRATCRFKALVRFVIQNLYWLVDVEVEEIGDDIQKNILLVTRRKAINDLTLMDKFILSKPIERRTEQEKLHLDRVIGGLSCFRRYPRHVKSQLAGATRFLYFGPGRTLIRQGHESHALYFILTGDVSVSQETFDPVLKKKVTTPLATLGPGNRIGEVALLHNIPRTATIVTKTHCEFLCLMKEDFDTVLRATVQQQWDDIKNAMQLLTYFENWDEMSIRECCLLSKINTYATDETVFGDGVGFPDYVYFVLHGQCQIIEHLLVISHIKNGKKYFKMYDSLQEDTVSRSTKTDLSQKTVKSHKKISSLFSSTHSRYTYRTVDSKYENDTTCETSNYSVSDILNVTSMDSFFPSISSTLKRKQTSCSHITGPSQSVSSVRTRLSAINLPCNVETHFMQVCILNPKVCFGIGENLNHRRIIATAHTKCLLIPRYWLMQRNTGNVWRTVLGVSNNRIPSTTQVFREFIKQRKWMEYRKKLFNELYKRKLPNVNSISNVPYFIRIHAPNFE